MKKTVKWLAALLCCVTVLSSVMLLPAQADGVMPIGQVTTLSTSLRVRTSPSVSSATVTQLTRHSYVRLLARNGSWYQVQLSDGRTGYCHADYITEKNSYLATVQNCYALRVRATANPDSLTVGYLTAGEEVAVLGDSATGNRVRILFGGGKTGYVHTAYLAKKAPSPVYTAVYLPLPDYKQYDPRWEGRQVGNSGKTVREIGCTLTALSMAESYRRGTAYTPVNALADNRFTSGGALYWPAGYSAHYDQNYLEVIYACLRQGIPVLFHGKTQKGENHWVVITGFTGGNTLDARYFTVNDPATVTRTTLAQYLSAYPVYVKMVWRG